jgi:hypothetical protein
MNLSDFKEKCKSDRVYITAVIILVGIGAFGLGRLSKVESERRGISIEAPSQVANVVMTEKTSINAKITTKNDEVSSTGDGQVVASKSGTKYHFPWCSGAKTISEANKIYFNSTTEARAAGYLPAGNCKGLK